MLFQNIENLHGVYKLQQLTVCLRTRFLKDYFNIHIARNLTKITDARLTNQAD